MRHQKGGNRLSRNRSLRKATLRDLAKATLIQERICTTSSRAKEARKLVDQLITLGKKDTLAARRAAFAVLCDHGLVSQLFQETAPRFKSRAGGYTRIIPYMNRNGDNAEMVFLELTEKSRESITGAKRVQKAAETEEVTEAVTKPATEAKAAKAEKAEAKSAGKVAAPKKPTGGVRKMFQRKTGGE